MRKGTLLLLFFFLLCSFSHAQYVTLEGRQFKDENGNDFYPVVCNYMTQYLFSDSEPEPFFPSPDISHDLWCYDCSSLSSCLDQIQRNLDTISAMNFNAIRLFMLNPVYYNSSDPKENWVQGWAVKATDLDYELSHACWIDDSIPDSVYNKAVYLTQSFGPDTVLDRILQYYDSVLLRAARSSIKVLLNVGSAIGDYSPVFRSGYGTYLALVADHFGSGTPVPGSKEDSIRKAILAYVILEEPAFSWKAETMWPTVTTGHSKQDVCQFISSLYDTLKQHDPHHLVTLGGVPYDLFEFDPGVMKLDFYSPHIYPQKRSYMGDNFFQGMVDETHIWFYWLANNVPMPYLIGETGFKSKYNDSFFSGNQGNNDQQKLFADSTLKIAKDCKASGYSWWYYQDYYWSDHDCYFGLLGRTGNQFNDTIMRKAVVTAFENFNATAQPSSMTRPVYYFDPYHHKIYSTLYGYDTSTIIHGHVQDHNGTPLKGVYIKGMNRLKGQYPDPVYMYAHYTFTNDYGNFTLIPFDYDTINLPDYNVIEKVQITSTGCSRIDSTNWGPIGISDNEIYRLDHTLFSFYDTLKNLTINFNDTTIYQAWAKLVVFDSVYVYGNGVFRAREEIEIQNEFQSFMGSEISICNNTSFPMCDSIDSEQISFLPISKSKAKKNCNSIGNEIALYFSPVDNVTKISVFPNPSNGTCTIHIPQDILVENATITIFDTMNRPIKRISASSEFTLFDISEISTGIYFLVTNTCYHSFSNKIIIQ